MNRFLRLEYTAIVSQLGVANGDTELYRIFQNNGINSTETGIFAVKLK